MPKYKNGKNEESMELELLHEYISKVKTERKDKQYLGVDPLRDKSLLALLYWTGLRISEIVGDRERTYKVCNFSLEERVDMKRNGIDWKKEDDAFVFKTSPIRLGIRKEDITERASSLYVKAEALKHGVRKAALETPLDLPYTDLVKEQWMKTNQGEKIWNLDREYAWEIVKEIDEKIYTHYFRFNRATHIARNPNTSPIHLLNWFGWRRVQTAYNYLELAGRYQAETAEVLRKEG